MRVLISDSVSEEGLAVFKQAKDLGIEYDYDSKITPEQLVERIGQYDGLVIRSRTKVTKEVIDAAANLKVIGRAGVGVDNVDVEAATDRGIIVMNTPSGNNISTAEHSIAMLMSLARKIPFAHASMADGKWDKKSFTGMELFNKTVGIIGLGRIGTIAAKRLNGLGMRVIAFDPFIDPDKMKPMGVEPATIDEIITKSDIITIHAPMTETTRNIINKDSFSKMKKSVLIINCARGGIVNEEDLAQALKDGKIGGAALDVFSTEPLPENHPLRTAPNCVLTPHVAASTVEAQENVAVDIAKQVVDALAGVQIINAVNMPSVDPEIWSAIKPYLKLAERLGKFAAQFSDQRITKLLVQYFGDIQSYPTGPLTTAVIKGLLESTTDDKVNYVNAIKKLDSRGVEVVTETHSRAFNYTNLITVITHHADGSTNSFSGTMFTEDKQRLVILNDKHFDAYLEGNMIVIENNDVPGVIGAVGTLLGQKKVNIGQMTWGRTKHSNEAMTVVNVDQQVSKELLKEITYLPNIKSAHLIRI